MPVNAPEFGEVWTTSDATSGRIMQGIVAEITPTRVLFVGLSGVRVAVPLARLGTTWNYIQPAPRRAMPGCERIGCPNPGMIAYNQVVAQATQGRSYYVCPKHVPSGVQCRITANYDPTTDPARIIRPGYECRSTPCPSCGHLDPAEDVRIIAFPARLWVCTACSARWVAVPVIPDEAQIDHLDQNFFARISHALAQLMYQEENVSILRSETWQTLFENHASTRGPGDSTAIVLHNGTQVTLNLTAFTEQVRSQFQAIMRVRAPVARQAERPVQRLGGAPNRGGVVGGARPMVARTLPAPQAPPPRPPNAMVYRPPGAPGDATAAADALRRLRALDDEQTFFQGPTSIEEPVAVSQVPIERGSLWVQRLGGIIIEVVEVLKATDGSEVVSFKRASSDDDPAVSLARPDFHIHHRPHKQEPEKEKPKINIEVAVNEEWGHKDGSALRITSVDARKEIVHGDDMKTQKHRQIPFSQFAAGQWRKIVRRSIYDRIRKPEINFSRDED